MRDFDLWLSEFRANIADYKYYVDFEKVYRNPIAKGEESKARAILQQLYLYYMKHPEEIPADFQPQLDFEGMPRTICDYIAGMTDKYAIYKYNEIFIPAAWQLR